MQICNKKKIIVNTINMDLDLIESDEPDDESYTFNDESDE